MIFDEKNYICTDKKIQAMINSGERPDVIKTTQMKDRGISVSGNKYMIEASTFITGSVRR